jgi:hypothetical protein
MEALSEESKRTTIRMAVEALVRFKREFNRDLTPSVLAELYVARDKARVTETCWLTPDDIINSVNGSPVKTPQDLAERTVWHGARNIPDPRLAIERLL